MKYLVENQDEWIGFMGPFTENITEKEVTSLEKDLEYLVTMKEMDEEIEEKRRKEKEGEAGLYL